MRIESFEHIISEIAGHRAENCLKNTLALIDRLQIPNAAARPDVQVELEEREGLSTFCVLYSPDGKMPVAAGGEWRTSEKECVRFRDAETGKPIRSLPDSETGYFWIPNF